jgi:hypothetical protein
VAKGGFGAIHIGKKNSGAREEVVLKTVNLQVRGHESVRPVSTQGTRYEPRVYQAVLRHLMLSLGDIVDE